MMMPPSLPCSLLMCSSAKYVPLITDVCTQKEGPSSFAEEQEVAAASAQACPDANFIYLQEYDKNILSKQLISVFYTGLLCVCVCVCVLPG